MKKLALTLATLGMLSAPVLACPHSEEKAAEAAPAPVTAEKAKAKEQPKATAKPTEKKTDEAKKAPEKKTDKVSSR
ncbi:hypothetical protein BH11MYX3_BH11MYX3_14190 [soil metagenome]